MVALGMATVLGDSVGVVEAVYSHTTRSSLLSDGIMRVRAAHATVDNPIARPFPTAGWKRERESLEQSLIRLA